MMLKLDSTTYSFNMKKFSWSGHKWIKQEPWGLIHPDKAWNYYDESAVEVDKNKTLHLKTHYNPKEIKHLGLFMEGTHMKYWGKEFYDTKFGFNYLIF